jgi:hypothetical protein
MKDNRDTLELLARSWSWPMPLGWLGARGNLTPVL